jgi:hypothetical protein
MQIGHPNSRNIELITLCPHIPWLGNADGTKGTSAFPYYLIAVHEEADDECAHAQLIADIILLRYRCTSLTMSSETTRALLKAESWVAAWIDLCFRSILSFALTSGMKTENSCSGNWSRWERCSSGKVARLTRRRTRIVIMLSSDGNGAFVSAVPDKRFHFITAAGL